MAAYDLNRSFELFSVCDLSFVFEDLLFHF